MNNREITQADNLTCPQSQLSHIKKNGHTLLVIVVCAAIYGADNWEDIVEFDEAKQEWFASF